MCGKKSSLNSFHQVSLTYNHAKFEQSWIKLNKANMKSALGNILILVITHLFRKLIK